MNTISIRAPEGSKSGYDTTIEIDGVDVSKSVLSAALYLRPAAPPQLEMEFLGLRDVSDVYGIAEWVAYADGETAQGSDIPTVLRELAAKIEAARAVPA